MFIRVVHARMPKPGTGGQVRNLKLFICKSIEDTERRRGKRIMQRWITVLMFVGLILMPDTQASAVERERGISISGREIVERLTRLEEGQKRLSARFDTINIRIDTVEKNLNTRIDSMEKVIQNQIDNLRDLMLVGFAVLLAGMFSLIGFVIWDRRSAISPVITRTREMEEKEALLFKAMKEFALKEPKMAEVLKTMGLL